jgi:hypothetical protein
VTEPAEQPGKTADHRDRRVYIWWGIALGLLALLGAFCWFFLRPYLEVRAAVERLSAQVGATTPDDEAIKMGGPEKAVVKCGFHLRLPARLTPHRVMAVLVLRSCGRPAVPVLIDALKDPDASIRMWAATVLGEAKDPRAVAPLITVLAALPEAERKGASAENVCWAAAAALGMLEDQRAIPVLVAASASESQFIRSAAAEALKKIRGEEPPK